MHRGVQSGSVLMKGALATSLGILSLFVGPSAIALDSTFPLARLAAGSRQAAAIADSVLADGTTLQLVQALAGPSTRQALLTTLGYFSLALDVPEVADRQWSQ